MPAVECHHAQAVVSRPDALGSRPAQQLLGLQVVRPGARTRVDQPLHVHVPQIEVSIRVVTAGVDGRLKRARRLRVVPVRQKIEAVVIASRLCGACKRVPIFDAGSVPCHAIHRSLPQSHRGGWHVRVVHLLLRQLQQVVRHHLQVCANAVLAAVLAPPDKLVSRVEPGLVQRERSSLAQRSLGQRPVPASHRLHHPRQPERAKHEERPGARVCWALSVTGKSLQAPDCCSRVSLFERPIQLQLRRLHPDTRQCPRSV